MLDERQRKTAERFGLTEKIEKLQRELLEIEYIEDVDFDLNGFYDNMNQVIFLIKYNIPVSAENYYSLRRKMTEEILETAARNGLKRTEDRIEDYGTWLYFVTKYQTSPDSRKKGIIKQEIKMYIVFENEMSNATFYFALTEEQMNDERSKVLFGQGIVKEIARVATVKEMKNLPTERKISYLNKKNEIKFA